MKNIIEKLSIESNCHVSDIQKMINEISFNLVREGCEKDDPRFLQYLIRRLRKRLKIQESNTYKTFKQFFKEN